MVVLSCCVAVTFAQEEAVPENPVSLEAEPAPDAGTAEPVTPEPDVPSDGEPSATAPAPAPETPAAARYVVFMPERVDLMWSWYYYTDVQQYFVQSAVEKALIGAGIEVIDLSMCDAFQPGGTISEVINPAAATQKAAALGATCAVVGQADAVKSSENIAYGVTVVRANANASARILRVKDGKVLAIEEATATGSGQSVQSATQEALKNVGRAIAPRIAAAAARAEAAP